MTVVKRDHKVEINFVKFALDFAPRVSAGGLT